MNAGTQFTFSLGIGPSHQPRGWCHHIQDESSLSANPLWKSPPRRHTQRATSLMLEVFLDPIKWAIRINYHKLYKHTGSINWTGRSLTAPGNPHISMYLCNIYISMYHLCIHVCMYLSIHLPIHTHLSVCLSIYVYQSLNQSVIYANLLPYWPVSFSVFPFI